MKNCRLCKTSKPLTEFYLRDTGHRRTECRECLIARSANQRPKTKEQNRKYRIESYGITVAEYELLREKQSARCAICGLSEEDNMHGKLFIDHDHNTSRVRGLLCSDCNTGLGKFRDNPALLNKAAEYIQWP